MGDDSAVVGELARGDVVRIEIEIDGGAGNWCKVIPQGMTAVPLIDIEGTECLGFDESYIRKAVEKRRVAY